MSVEKVRRPWRAHPWEPTVPAWKACVLTMPACDPLDAPPLAHCEAWLRLQHRRTFNAWRYRALAIAGDMSGAEAAVRWTFAHR